MGAFDLTAAAEETRAQFPTSDEMNGVAVRDNPSKLPTGKRNIESPRSGPAEPPPVFNAPSFEKLNGIEDVGDEEDDVDDGKGKDSKPGKPAADAGEISASLRAEAESWGFTAREIEDLGTEKALTTAIFREARRARSAPASATAKKDEPKEEEEEPDIELTDEDAGEKVTKAIKQSRAKLAKARAKLDADIAAHKEHVEKTFEKFDQRFGLDKFDLAIALDPNLRQILGDDDTEDLEPDSEFAARRVRLMRKVSATRAEIAQTGRRVPTVRALTKRLASEMFEKEIGALKEEETQSAAERHGRSATAARPTPARSASRDAPPGPQKAAAAERNFWKRHGGR